MTIRELPPEEFSRLADVPELRGLEEQEVKVLVGEDDGEIVAFWLIGLAVHLEPIWVREDKRNGLVVGRLWKEMRRILDACGINSAFSTTGSDEVAGYLERLGFVHQGASYLWTKKD